MSTLAARAPADRPRGPWLARGTPLWLPAGVALGAGLAVAGGPRGRRLGGIGALAAAGAAGFYRDPERPLGDGAVLTPADGVISSVSRRADGRVRVATYMRLRDVHVNRAPLAGVVRSLVHRRGGFLPAWHKGSDRNERLTWSLETALGELEVVQIAGVLVRRIVPYLDVGDRVERGERLGLIRFGSRVDVVLPAGVEAGVVEGERVRAGITRLDRG